MSWPPTTCPCRSLGWRRTSWQTSWRCFAFAAWAVAVAVVDACVCINNQQRTFLWGSALWPESFKQKAQNVCTKNSGWQSYFKIHSFNFWKNQCHKQNLFQHCITKPDPPRQIVVQLTTHFDNKTTNRDKVTTNRNSIILMTTLLYWEVLQKETNEKLL